MKAYESLICQYVMAFEKLIRLITIGMMKVLGCVPKEKLHQIESFDTEEFRQLVICAQKAKAINVRNYKGINVTKTANAFTVTLRQCYDEDITKVLPIIEVQRLTKKLINYLHRTWFGNWKVGRSMHLSAGNAMKINFNNGYGFYQRFLKGTS